MYRCKKCEEVLEHVEVTWSGIAEYMTSAWGTVPLDETKGGSAQVDWSEEYVEDYETHGATDTSCLTDEVEVFRCPECGCESVDLDEVVSFEEVDEDLPEQSKVDALGYTISADGLHHVYLVVEAATGKVVNGGWDSKEDAARYCGSNPWVVQDAPFGGLPPHAPGRVGWVDLIGHVWRGKVVYLTDKVQAERPRWDALYPWLARQEQNGRVTTEQDVAGVAEDDLDALVASLP